MYEWLREELKQAYEEERLLKESERGSVHLIRHRRTGARAILRQFQGNGAVYRRLLSCRCRNLPEILEAAEKDGKVLVLEEYIGGDKLSDLLKASRLSPKETRLIVRDLCRGLWVLHSLETVHRDIKPENVILRGREAVLIDFDAARLYKAEYDNDTQILGTTGFAAPEQYGLAQSDIRADIYALGVLINVMLTGRHPTQELASGHLGWVVQRCTQVSPEKRYQTVLQLMEAL